MVRRFVAVIVVGLAVVACGSSKSMKEFTPSSAEKGQATETVTSALKLQEVKSDNGDPNSALNGLNGILSNASSLVSAQQARNLGAGGMTGALLAAVSSALQEGCVTRSGGKTTYNCTDSSQSVVGYIEVSGDSFSVDLSIKESGELEALYKGSVTVTSTLVNGSLSLDYKTSQVTYNLDVVYGNITLQDNCPISGTLSVDANYDISGLPSGYAAGNLDASVEFTFGPKCGDVAARGG